MQFFTAQRYLGKRFGEYTVEAIIGEGRYGLCFLAKTDYGAKVIIKKFKPNLFAKNTEKNVFEAVILSKLKDERIPELLGVINQKGLYGFVLEWKPGITVKDMIFKHGYEFSSEEFYHIGLNLINIIEYLHKNGIVHRDIRIPNVLIDRDKIYLIDFGLARFADNNQYKYDLDYSYLGDFLLYFLYSSYKKNGNKKNLPWYEELSLNDRQRMFLKKLLGLEAIYKSIKDIEVDFIESFGH